MRVFDMRRPTGDQVRVRASFRVVSGEVHVGSGHARMRCWVFSNADTASSRPVAVVNATFADRYLGDRAVGAVVPLGSDEQPDWEIVGVVDNVRSADTSPVGPEMFVPAAQWLDGRPGGNPVIALRTAGPPTQSVTHPACHRRRHRSGAGPGQGPDDGGAGRGAAGETPAVFRPACGICCSRADYRGRRTFRRAVVQRGTALARAGRAVGAGVITGVVAAAGPASGSDTDVSGLVTGMSVSLAMAGALGQRLYGVSGRDPVTYIAVGLILLGGSAIACVAPALRAARLDPLVVLKRG